MGRHRTSVPQLGDRPHQICISFPQEQTSVALNWSNRTSEGSNSSHTACNEAKAVMDFHL